MAGALMLVGAVRQGQAKGTLTECLAEFDLDGTAAVPSDGGLFECTDCDPACDSGAPGQIDQQCVFRLTTCTDLTDAACTGVSGATIKKAKVKPRNLGLTHGSSPCGSFVGVSVRTKKNGKKLGKKKIKVLVTTTDRKMDKDKLTLVCKPQTGTCPTTSTTTTTTTSTTVTTIVCGNGVREGNEACDPPCQAGGTCTGAGQVCNSDCSGCIQGGPCNLCGAPTPTGLTFTNTIGSGSCGSVTPAFCAQSANAGTPCTLDSECPGGRCIGNLACGGLYFGGAGVSTPVPASPPDMGVNLVKVGCCEQDGNTMQLVASTILDSGSSRTCTSGNESSPEYDNALFGNKKGCLFGGPLPITNPPTPATSVCIVNRVVGNASGTAVCTTGAANINLPLLSDLYLTGDLLDGAAADRPAVLGIQPCPLCTGNLCQGGPRHGMACTPGTSTIGACAGGGNAGGACIVDGDCPTSTCDVSMSAYPTSHDCPPPAALIIGGLPIPFGLSTGTQTKTAVDFPPAGDPGRDNVFCGFCGLAIPGASPFEGPPPRACTSDADCTNVAFPRCRQRTAGAFGNGAAETITATGSPAGNISDRASHASTLVSVFCIPPSYTPLVDGAGDLPGPGAIALPGNTRLLP